jgi:hypothetical protein
MRSILAILALLSPTLAGAQSNCMAREIVTGVLIDQYGESITGEGLVTMGGVPAILQVWSSPETGTFSVVITRPDGIACVAASGENWIALEPQSDPGEPS